MELEKLSKCGKSKFVYQNLNVNEVVFLIFDFRIS